MKTNYKSLYEVTGRIEDVCTFLVPLKDLPSQEQADPMDTMLPCDVRVGHVTIRKGVALRALVMRMQTLYDMATVNEKGCSSQPDQERAESVGLSQVYRCKIKSRKQIDREIPRDKQGWWADISAGQLIRLREATQADVDRCTLNEAHSKDPADYMCETHTNGSLVSKAALEYMNPEQNVFASHPKN